MNKIKKATIWADSILKGVIYDDQVKKYKILKENGIYETSKELGIELDNNAKFGLTAPKACRLLKEKTIKKVEGECALIELGGNDSDYCWSEVSNNPEGIHNPNTSIIDFKESIKEMVKEFKDKNIEPILVNLPPIDAKKYFEWISRGLDKNNILLWLGSVDRIYTHHEAYSLAIMDVGRELNCKCLDIREEFLKMDYQDMLCIDGIHLNKKGQDFLKNIFCLKIRQYDLI